MHKRLSFALGLLALAVLLVLVVWQGSFSFGEYGPVGPQQTFVFWAISTLVFLLTITLGFMLFRTALKLYIERSGNREGSRIKTKLVVGALALCFVPVVFQGLFSFEVLNRNLAKWFSNPAEGVKDQLVETARAIDIEVRARAAAQARWIASLPQTRAALELGDPDRAFFAHLCEANRIERLTLSRGPDFQMVLCSGKRAAKSVRSEVEITGASPATLQLDASMAADLLQKQVLIDRNIHDYYELAANQKKIRNFYLLLLLLITLFILFVASWIALFMARQISVPISALLEASGEVRRGNLSHRVRVPAMDELATLVRSFNEMTQELEANSRELESRRRFTEAILESIPTGVISLSSDGKIQRVNRAMRNILTDEQIQKAIRLEDLFSRDDTAEIKYLMKRARRIGSATSTMELVSSSRVLHLAITVSALEDSLKSGFVLVLEDTSELLRAQKAAAWHEVARRIAHELKNPLTPISLCAERIARQLDRAASDLPRPAAMRILRECSATILREVASVKSLADEFSQFSRFPAAHPVPADLNAVVRQALSVFDGRLSGIDVRIDLAEGLPSVQLDPEQFKRVVVNLVDNAAEAMHDSIVKRLSVVTRAAAPDAVELIVVDTGCGVSPQDKEKLFLPYFSTKGRGTGLGLAIVNHVLAEHNARIRVEDNVPMGARFIVEVPAVHADEPALEPAPVPAGTPA